MAQALVVNGVFAEMTIRRSAAMQRTVPYGVVEPRTFALRLMGNLGQTE